MSRRGLSHAELLEELKILPADISDCESPYDDTDDEDSDCVINIPDSQKSSDDSDEETSILPTMTRSITITDIASTSSDCQPISSHRGRGRSIGRGRCRGRSYGRGHGQVQDIQNTKPVQGIRLEEIGSDGTVWRIMDSNQKSAGNIYIYIVIFY